MSEVSSKLSAEASPLRRLGLAGAESCDTKSNYLNDANYLCSFVECRRASERFNKDTRDNLECPAEDLLEGFANDE